MTTVDIERNRAIAAEALDGEPLAVVAELMPGSPEPIDEPEHLAAERADAHLELASAPMDDAAESSSLVDRLRRRLLSADDVEALPPPEYLLDELLVRDTIAVAYGPPGAGKSLLALDWAASAASGAWWFGHEVRKGRVLYVAAEGLAGMGKRLRAWKSDRNVGNLDALTFMAGAVNLASGPDAIALRTIAVESKPDLIVVDTLARSIPGADENSARDMGLVVDRLDDLRTATGATVLVVHHVTRAEGTMRGSTAIEGAADTTIAVKGAEGRLTVTVTKQKDDRRPSPLHFFLVPVGDSCVLSDRPGSSDEGALTDQGRQVLEILARAALDDGLSASDWLNLCLDQSIAKASFYNHRKALVSNGLVHVAGTGARPRYKPATSTNDNPHEEH